MGGGQPPRCIDRGVTDNEILDRVVAHLRRLEQQRDMLNDEIEQAEQLWQAIALHLASTSKNLTKARTPEHMTVADATRYLRASKNTIKAWIADDRIPSHVDPDGRRYLLKSEIDSWLLDGRRPLLRRAA